MRLRPAPRTAAVSSIVLGLLAAILTNLVTDQWSWTLAVALLAVAVCWIGVEAWRAAPRTTLPSGGRPSVRQKATSISGRLTGIRKVEGPAVVDQTIDQVAAGGEVVGIDEVRRDGSGR